MTDYRQSLVGNDGVFFVLFCFFVFFGGVGFFVVVFLTCQSGDVCVIILIDNFLKQCSGVWLRTVHVFEGWL